MGKLTEADNELRALLRDDPDFSRARQTLAEVLFLQGDLTSASREWRTLILSDPANILARLTLASYLLRQNAVASAIQELKNLLAVKADYAPAHNLL